ncbi:hypothetical protein CFS9_26700 [Flavobacterium sp. CFS9]|uniref:Transposase n=1 Tax=Flavobacterium sp. CFS9 TaxID=3143118 RepID=A0AAT9H3I9_9FLAO
MNLLQYCRSAREDWRAGRMERRKKLIISKKLTNDEERKVAILCDESEGVDRASGGKNGNN